MTPPLYRVTFLFPGNSETSRTTAFGELENDLAMYSHRIRCFADSLEAYVHSAFVMPVKQGQHTPFKRQFRRPSVLHSIFDLSTLQ